MTTDEHMRWLERSGLTDDERFLLGLRLLAPWCEDVEERRPVYGALFAHVSFQRSILPASDLHREWIDVRRMLMRSPYAVLAQAREAAKRAAAEALPPRPCSCNTCRNDVRSPLPGCRYVAAPRAIPDPD